jgi:hypothetical protein
VSEVERYTFGLLQDQKEPVQLDNGEWVRYSDYEKLAAERDEAIKQRDYDYKRFSEAKGGLIDADKRCIELEAERDQATQSERQRIRETLTGVAAEILAQRAYERALNDLPLVTPRWDEADPQIKDAFIYQARSDMQHFVLPALDSLEDSNGAE